MTEYNLNSYRKARIITKDLEDIRASLKEAYKKLNKYKKYIPVQGVLNEILNAEVVLKAVYSNQLAVLKTKGEVNE